MQVALLSDAVARASSSRDQISLDMTLLNDTMHWTCGPTMPMRGAIKPVLVLPLLLPIAQADGDQQATQPQTPTQVLAAAPDLRISDLAGQYSWDQIHYGPAPRPRRISLAEKRARRTSDTLARWLGFVLFEDKTFGEIIDDYFAGQHHLDVVVDWDAPAAGGSNVTRDSRVTLQLDRATVEEVLQAVLEQLSESAQTEDAELTFYVLDGKVKVSTRGEFDKLIVSRVYNISFIGRGTPHYLDAPELGLNRRLPPDLVEPPPDPNLPRQAGTRRTPRRNFEELRAQLIQILKDFHPQKWKENGGQGTISIMGNELMIRQTCEMHELIGGKWW